MSASTEIHKSCPHFPNSKTALYQGADLQKYIKASPRSKLYNLPRDARSRAERASGIAASVSRWLTTPVQLSTRPRVLSQLNYPDCVIIDSKLPYILQRSSPFSLVLSFCLWTCSANRSVLFASHRRFEIYTSGLSAFVRYSSAQRHLTIFGVKQPPSIFHARERAATAAAAAALPNKERTRAPNNPPTCNMAVRRMTVVALTSAARWPRDARSTCTCRRHVSAPSGPITPRFRDGKRVKRHASNATARHRRRVLVKARQDTRRRVPRLVSLPPPCRRSWGYVAARELQRSRLFVIL